MSRFVVTTVSGYRTLLAGGDNKPGMSAHVLDTAYNYAVVASFRSEDHRQGKNGRLGIDGALEAAQAAARSLNALHSMRAGERHASRGESHAGAT